MQFRMRFVSEANKLERILSKESRAALAKIGGFGRTAMKDLLNERGTLVKKRKIVRQQTMGNRSKSYKQRLPSKPGTPPHRVDGTLRRLVFWGFDQNLWSVVVGPLRFGKGEAPALHDRGGRRRFRSSLTGNTYNAIYPQRPYVEQARDDALADLNKAWAGSRRRNS